MKTLYIISILCFFLSCAVKEKDESVVLARVNDQVLTVNKLEKLLPPGERTDERLRGFIHEWVDNALFFEAAAKEGFHWDEHLQNARDVYYKKIIISSYLQTKTSADIEITNYEIRQYYDSFSDGFSRQEDEAYIHHFFTENRSDARVVRAGLTNKKSGESLDELFKTYNVETKTVTKGFLPKKLDRAIFQNKKESIAGPIRTDNGYHVIEIRNRYKKGSRRGMEDVYDEIYQRLLKQKQVMRSASLLDSLKEKTHIFINSNYQ